VSSAKSAKVKKFLSYGGAAAVASAGLAGASVALSPPASAFMAGYGCGGNCRAALDASPSEHPGVIDFYGWTYASYSGNCNIALYQGTGYVVGGALAQTPQVACGGSWAASDSYNAGAKGGNYSGAWTVEVWINNTPAYGYAASYPFGGL
jgi:hypothetical protein